MIDYKKFTKLFYFIFCYQKFHLSTRITLMAIMEYHNIYAKQSERFELSPLNLKKKFEINEKQLVAVLDYFTKFNWIWYEKVDDKYKIQIDYDAMDEFYLRQVKPKDTIKKIRNNKITNVVEIPKEILSNEKER